MAADLDSILPSILQERHPATLQHLSCLRSINGELGLHSLISMDSNHRVAEYALISQWSFPQPLQKDKYNLPACDALSKILPDYLVSSTRAEQGQDANTEEAQSNMPGSPSNPQQPYHQPHRRPPLPNFEGDPHMADIADLQTKEADNYRAAMHKMADDIIALRTQVMTLGAENSQLRSDLSLHQDLGRDLLDDTDIDVMTKAEVADRIADLKFKLAGETTKATSYRDKIQQLQNELIKKNDSEKELLNLQKYHQEDLQRCQRCVAKVTSLEATVKQQEKVIEKMESVLNNKLTVFNKQKPEKKQKRQTGATDGMKEAMESALAAENARLRGELQRMHQQPAPIVIQQVAQPQERCPEMERLTLLSKLETAELRIKTVETQLEENSKLWGKQKQDMLTKLSEHRHGLA